MDSWRCHGQSHCPCLLGVTQALERIKPQIPPGPGTGMKCWPGAIAAAHMKIAVARDPWRNSPVRSTVPSAMASANSPTSISPLLPLQPPTAWPLPAKKVADFPAGRPRFDDARVGPGGDLEELFRNWGPLANEFVLRRFSTCVVGRGWHQRKTSHASSGALRLGPR